MRPLLALVAPLALVACGAPAPSQPKEPPPIVEMPRRAAEPAKPAEPPAPPAEPAPGPPPTATLIDLGGTPPPAPPPAPPPTPSAAANEKPDAAAVAMSNRLERERREQRVKEAEATIAELEKRLLAIANPFLPRPQLPPEEAEAWQGLDGVKRRERVNKQLEEARTELEAAQQSLKALGGN
ncbi:MAG TPA: hypothetical protein VF139_09575 [Candidatus Polarisedimenticolaceae bacterium]